jgi:protease-4
MKYKGCFIISVAGILLTMIFCVIVVAFSVAMINYDFPSTQEVVIGEGSSSEKVGVIDLDGVIISGTDAFGTDSDMVENFLKKLDKIKNDDDFKAVIIKVNTPGGTVYDSDKIAKEIVKFREAGKEVVIVMEESATSGGYYISAPANKIIASEVSVTGSIGVVSQIIKLDGLYEKIGIDVITITNTEGDIKTFENLDDPDSLDRKVYQELLDDNFNAFVDVIIENRNMTREEVLKIADGSIYSGKKALELGLVDELGGMDEAIESVKVLSELSNPKLIHLIDQDDFWDEVLSNSFMSALNRFDTKIQSAPGIYTWYIFE